MSSIKFPSMKSRELMRLLKRLGFVEESGSGGSHRWVVKGEKRLRFAFHDKQTIAPGLVKKILTKDLALTDEEISDVL